MLRETEPRISPAGTSRRILVVGAGPAGLKAAGWPLGGGTRCICTTRPRSPAGALRGAGDTAAAALVSSVEYLVAELGGLGVKVVRGTIGDAELGEIGPD